MKQVIKMVFIFSVFSSTLYSQGFTAYNPDEEEEVQTDETGKMYSIGTGLSFNYLYENLGLIVDSYHFFDVLGNNSPDKIILKAGLGFNYSLGNPTDVSNDPIDPSPIGIIATGSLGYFYVLNQERITDSRFKQLGIGLTFDYSFIASSSSIHTESTISSLHTIGATVYFKLDAYLIGLGSGTVVGVKSGRLDLYTPYTRINFGVVF